MKVLLTGSSGFIGRNIIKVNSPSIRFVLLNRYSVGMFDDDINFTTISEDTDWSENLKGIDSIIHLAGIAHKNNISESDVFSVNVKGTLKLAEAAAKSGVRRFVFLSSVNVEHLLHSRISTSGNLDMNSSFIYSNAKLQAEIGLKKIAADTGLEVTIVRSPMVYGKDAPGNFALLIKLVKVLPFLPFGLTDNKRDFIAVQNLADLLIKCVIHNDAAGRTFIASDFNSISTKELTNAIAKGLNKTLIQLPVSVSLMRCAARVIGKQAMAEQLLGNLQVDSSNAKEVLGWTPPLTMEQAMASLSENKK